MSARSASGSAQGGLGSGSLVGSSADNTYNEALRKSPLEGHKFIVKQSASLNRLLALVRNGVMAPPLLPDYAERDEFKQQRRNVLLNSSASEWAGAEAIPMPERLQEFINTGGAAQRRANARQNKLNR